VRALQRAPERLAEIAAMATEFVARLIPAEGVVGDGL